MNKSSNVFKFHGSNMIVHAKGPNIDKNISTSFRSNLLSSTMNLPRNFERQGYAESVSSQRSMFYGRELSPTASVRSDFQPRNFHQPFNQGYSQRSAYYGRGGSPVSMRSIDSTASVATDIAQGIKNGNFNKHEWRIILEAVNNKRRHHFRRRAEKRRRLKVYLQNTRNRSGDDSGEQGSNSSLSSDDCMSTRTGYSRRLDRNYKENVPQSLPSLEIRSTDTNVRSDTRDTRGYTRSAMEIMSRTGSEVTCSQKDMQSKSNINTFYSQMHKNMYSSQSKGLNDPRNMFSSQRYMNLPENEATAQRNTLNASVFSTKSLQTSSVQMPKDRFKNGFQFSSQRFNTSLKPIDENKKNENANKNNNKRKQTNDMGDNVSSEDDSIFLDTTVKPTAAVSKHNTRQKRNVECLDNVPMSAKKKIKTTPLNMNETAQKTTKTNDFVFAKPQFPVKKKPIEKLISKSADPFTNVPVHVQENCTQVQAHEEPNQSHEAEHEPTETSQLTNSDISMRPSFRKRKLFTQTLDITERRNNSSESLSADSPQSNIYSALSKEKHKTRKLTTTQSLLSRDVNQDDSNLLDLIHKIVPPSLVNSTNIAKASQAATSGTKTGSDGDYKWDITSILSTCKNDSMSDTYTDDEIFKVTNGDKTSKPNKTKEKSCDNQGNKNNGKKERIDKPDNKNVTSKCNVIIEKLTLAPPAVPQVKSPIKAGPPKKVTLSNSRIDAFWNTDAESDYECPTPRGPKGKYFQDATNNNDVAATKQNIMKSVIEGQPNSSCNKILKNTPTLVGSLVVNKNDTTLVKALKKQTNKINTTKSNATTQKNVNNKEAQPEQAAKLKKAPTAKVNMRRQTKNVPTVEDVSLPKNDLQAKMNGSGITSKQNNTKKTKEKMIKSPIASESARKRNKSRNDCQSQADKTKQKSCATHQSLSKTKIQDDIEDIQNGTICKVLRSRAIDLSSSFNSDKFELTGLSRARKSRTPSKRISFNKSKNVTVNKGRNKKII